MLAARIEEDVKSIADYCDLEKTVGFSYTHIRDLFKRTTNISLSRYILARRIANAAFDIRHSGKTITEIAYEYGFSNLDTFTRAFRRCVGFNPSEFKKSSHLCGRRIICPGIYAPVILDFDDSLFTLHHIKEVNKMGEMQKTTDSCILYGVPKVYFGRTVDGQMQLTPFPMCLQSVLNYIGQNISYTQIMAASGVAFSMRFDTKGWNMGAADISLTYKESTKPFELAFRTSGRRFKIIEEPDKSKAKTTYLAHIKTELDCGRPLIALGVVGPPEACILTGYQNGGETLLGWSLFQDGGPFDENLKTHEAGYFIRENWWENTQAIMSIGEEVGTLASTKEILESAFTLMTEEMIDTCNGSRPFYGGQAAYVAWAKTVEDDSLYTDSTNMFVTVTSHQEQEMMLWCRGLAAIYVGSLAEKYPALSQDLSNCSKLLRDTAECVQKMQATRGGRDDENAQEKFRDKEIRLEIASYIRQAAAYEKAACALIKTIIGELS